MTCKKQAVLELLSKLHLPDIFQSEVRLDSQQLTVMYNFLIPFFNEYHNNAPKLRKMVELALKYDGIIEGYIVPTRREDSRFSADTLYFNNLKPDDLMSLVNEYSGSADELTVHSYDPVTNTFKLRLWWD